MVPAAAAVFEWLPRMSVLRTEFFVSLDRFLDGLVHPDAARDAVLRARHRAFIAAHLTAGALALAVTPIYWALNGRSGILEVAILMTLAALAPVALIVSRTGRLALGHVLAAIAMTGLVAFVASVTGGLSSLALLWLILVPIEATLSGRRAVVMAAVAIAGAGIGAVGLLEMGGYTSQPLAAVPHGMVAMIAATALTYGALLAMRIDALARVGTREAARVDAQYRIVSEALTDIVTGHGDNGDVVFASPAVRSVLGVTPSDVAGDGLFRRIHVADRPTYLTALSEAMNGGVISTAEFRVRPERADVEGFLWMEMRCRPTGLTGPEAHSARVVAVTRDMTLHKAQEDALSKAREDAETASLAKSRFLANVSHELRTPLNAIIGFSEILGTNIFGRLEDPRQREYVRLIHESGNHLLQVVNAILDASKIEAGNFAIVREPFDLPALIASVRDMLSHQAESASLSLEVLTQPGMGELIADRRACKQILINLVSNAIKFTRPGGKITLGARREPGATIVYVRDTGIGIDPKDLPRLGTPFVQADTGYDRKHEGTGLGLSMVKGLAELHGGTFVLESQLGIGTVATVRLPDSYEPAPKQAPQSTIVRLEPDRAGETRDFDKMAKKRA
jgi:two-component system, cell cycle sensor histidine kinase DivJ